MNLPASNLRNLLTSLFLGLNSGLCYALIGSTFTAYLHDNHINLAIIGLLSCRLLPYSFKYLWAPFVDNLNISIFPKDFGQRKMWIISAQILLMIAIFSLGFVDIKDNFKFVFVLSFIIALLAATHDIAMEAFRIELFNKEYMHKASLANLIGFRIGLIITGAGGLFISHFIAWNYIFMIAASLILPCIWFVYRSKDMRVIDNPKINITMWSKKFLLEPLLVLFKIPNFMLTISVIAFYKLSDNYLDTMLIPFLSEIGYSKIQIASVVQTMSIGASITGAVIGSYLIGKVNVIKNLFYIEILAALSNLCFLSLINSKVDYSHVLVIIIVENLISGISNIVLINYMSSLCDRKFTATHYAILVSISGIFRTIISSSSGFIALNYGWINFFIISALLSIPSLIALKILKFKAKTN